MTPRRGRVFLYVVVAWGALLLPIVPAHALNIGTAQVRSYIGEPLEVDIPVQAESWSTLQARLLPPGEGASASFAQVTEVSDFRVSLDRSVVPPLIRIRSQKPQREPVLQLLLQLRQADTSMEFAVNVLLDPSPPASVTTPRAAPPREQKRPVVARREAPLISTRPIVTAPVATTPTVVKPAPKTVVKRETPARRSLSLSTEPPAPRIAANTEAIFLRPGLFALQTQFDSYKRQRAEQVAGLAKMQEGEPERFQADWVLSVNALPVASRSRAASSAVDSTLVSQAQQRPEPTLAAEEPPAGAAEESWESVHLPTPDLEQTLPQLPVSAAQEEPWVQLPEPTVVETGYKPKPVVPNAPVRSAGEQEGSHWRGLLWVALFAILGFWFWRWRANRNVIHADFKAADLPEAIPPLVFPEAVDTASPSHNFGEPENGVSEARKLRERIRRLRTGGKLSEAQLNELRVAEVMLGHSRLDAARRILAELA